MQSVELLLDPATDEAVRAQWAALSAAGLPSQLDHRGPTNAPHLTVGLAGATTPAAEEALAGVAARLPLPVRLGSLLVLGHRRLTLARLVVPTTELLALHVHAAEAWEALAGVPELVRPGRWTPHVTLARGLDPRLVTEGAQALQGDGSGDLVGEAVGLRRWDPATRRAWVIPSRVVDHPRGHGGD